MGSIFEPVWPIIIDHEGKKYTNAPWDPGGSTKFGITLRTALATKGIDFDADKDGDVDADDIMLMDEVTAKKFYKQWWDTWGYGNINDQRLANKVMDISINMGPRGVAKSGSIYGAHVLVQKAVNKVAGTALMLDGKLGPVSYNSINLCDPTKLVVAICELQMQHYKKWCDGFTKTPGDREKARVGLYKRASWPFMPGTIKLP